MTYDFFLSSKSPCPMLCMWCTTYIRCTIVYLRQCFRLLHTDMFTHTQDVHHIYMYTHTHRWFQWYTTSPVVSVVLRKLRMMLSITDIICPPHILLYTSTSNLCNTGPLTGVLTLLQGVEKSLFEITFYHTPPGGPDRSIWWHWRTHLSKLSRCSFL
jgi:hypothetical protein